MGVKVMRACRLLFLDGIFGEFDVLLLSRSRECPWNNQASNLGGDVDWVI